jgi:hypothetical protein
MSLEIVSWLNSNGSAITAFATVALAVITWKYVKLTYSLLDEQRKTRRIQELHKKLEYFYIPFWQHISLYQYPPNSEKALEFFEKFNNDTVYKDFMKYMYLCENPKIRSDLEMLLNERERSKLQAGLVGHIDLVKKDINTLVEELNKLQSF